MNTEATTIFDLLLGPAGNIATGGSADSSRNCDSAVFDSILAGLIDLGALGDNGSATGTSISGRPDHGLPEPSAELWARLLSQSSGLPSAESGRSFGRVGTPRELSAPAPEEPAHRVAGDMAARPFNLLAASGASVGWLSALDDQTGKAAEAVSAETAPVEMNVLAFNRSIAEALPREDRIVNQSLEHMLNSRPVELTGDRQYRITSVEQGSGLLQLTLSDPSDSERPIKVALPLTSLARGLEGQDPVNGRVNLQTEQSAAAHLQRLLSRLSLREISITGRHQGSDVTDGASAEETPDAKQLTIVANDSGRRVVLRTQLSAEELRTPLPKGPAEPPATEKAARPLPENDQTFARAHHASVEPERLARSAAAESGSMEPRVGFDLMRSGGAGDARDQSLQRTESRLDSSWRSEAILSNARETGAESAPGGSDHGSGELGSRGASAVRQGAANQPVRFHLPHDFGSLLRNGRQTLTIRIEPEHLGPARLTLTERDGGLQARLIVSSPEARALIESSLDRLSRQLQQANVDVQSIEVTVSADSEHRELFHERPDWIDWATRSGRVQTNTEIEQGGQEIVMPPRATHQIGAGGIDVLA